MPEELSSEYCEFKIKLDIKVADFFKPSQVMSGYPSDYINIRINHFIKELGKEFVDVFVDKKEIDAT